MRFGSNDDKPNPSLLTFRYKEDKPSRQQNHCRLVLLLGILVLLCVVAWSGIKFQRDRVPALPIIVNLPPSPHPRSHPYCLLDNDEEYWSKTKLWKAQHPVDCLASKLFVVVPSAAGFGASILSLTSVLRTWHELGWVLVLAPRFKHGFWYFSDATDCPNSKGDAWSCYFRVVSNCTINHALERAGVARLEDAPQYGTARANASVIVFSGYKSLKVSEPGEALPFVPPQINPTNAFYLRYLLRFNRETDDRLIESFERISRVDPRTSLALPIRASERCGYPVHGAKPMKSEGGCLALETYVELIVHLQGQLHRPIETVLVTSEDERYIKAAQARPELWRTMAPVYNNLDAHPGTSKLADVPNTTHWNQLVSMLTTLEFLLQSDVFVLNCASHFHLLLGLLRISDCPTQATRALPQVRCLDTQNVPQQYRICDPAKDPACEDLTKRVIAELSG